MLQKERNAIMHEIHDKLKIERNKRKIDKIETIECAKNDSTKRFKALRAINRKKCKEKIFIKENNVIANCS